MGTVLKVIGIIAIIVGVIFIPTAIGTVAGVSMIINGITLFAIGAIYNAVREIKEKLK